jgi:signal transduction histidine kinase
MNDSEKIKTRPSLLERYAWAMGGVWTVVVTASLIWNVFEVKHQTLEAARIQAQSAYEKDVIYRRWNAQHGGVYVPVTEETQPNPYLSHIPDRNISTPSGKLLTLMNPAYMTRQAHEIAEKEQGVRGHITSLNPIRPQNSPDPWETKALQAFESGQTEISSVEEMEGKEYMRLMRPLVTEKGCLKCHAAQGYQEGDIRGGISISIPMDSLKAIARAPMLTFALGHVLLWLMGLGGIVLATERLKQRESARRQAAEALEKAKDELEIRVEERTSELEIANEQLREEITERKRVEEALRQAHNELEVKVAGRTKELTQANIRLKELDRLKTMFIASVSHELRTPLNSIIGLTGIILQGISGKITEDQRKELTMVKNSADHLSVLINDVIDVSEIEAAQIELAIEELDLADLIQEVRDSFKVAVDEKGLKMSLETPERLIIKSDRRRAKQVIINLVSNAVKFTDKGEIAINAAKKDEGVEVSVADTGIGIKKENMKKLFKQFSRIHIAGRTRREGTGLGLYLSKKIADLLGGEIKAKSEFEKGSKFAFILPLKYKESSP